MAIVASNLGKFMKVRRAELRKSLQDVAELADLSKAHVWDIERGKSRNPNIATVLGLAFALECNPLDLAARSFSDQPGVSTQTREP